MPSIAHFGVFDYYASKGAKYDFRLIDFEVVLKERTTIPGTSELTNRTAIPYKYLIAGGIVLVFTGISILVFAVKKQTVSESYKDTLYQRLKDEFGTEATEIIRKLIEEEK